MALQIIRNPAPAAPGLVADRRLCVTADRSRVVEERDPAAAYLLAAAGSVISAEDVGRYQLARAEDGTIQVAAAESEEAAKPEEPAPAKTPKSSKGGKPGSDA